MALWAVARRTTGLTLADAQEAFERGDFLRTHILRPTWHFVDPADLPWLMTLTAPRIRQIMTSSWVAMGLAPDLIDRGSEVIAAVLVRRPAAYPGRARRSVGGSRAPGRPARTSCTR